MFYCVTSVQCCHFLFALVFQMDTVTFYIICSFCLFKMCTSNCRGIISVCEFFVWLIFVHVHCLCLCLSMVLLYFNFKIISIDEMKWCYTYHLPIYSRLKINLNITIIVWPVFFSTYNSIIMVNFSYCYFQCGIHRWVWHGEGFTYLENVVFYDTFMDLRPFVYKFPSEMYPYAGEFKQLW